MNTKRKRENRKGESEINLMTKPIVFTVPFRGPPRYNPKRRSGLGWTVIGGGGMVSSATMLTTLTRIGIGPPSPCPSDHPFSSASSSLSEGSSSHRSHEDDISIVTGKVTMKHYYTAIGES